jgi:Holliday junction resolvasome RuvABC endonuclease subunit
MRHCLALDQARNRIGWALGSVDMERPLCGVHPLPSVGARHGAMLGHVRDWLDTMIKTYHVHHLIYETPFAGVNIENFAVVNKMLGVIELVCDDHEIGCVRAAPVEWRARFLGCGAAPKAIGKGLSKSAARAARTEWLKQASVAACVARGWPVENHDEADACGLLDFGLACHSAAYRERKEGETA